MNETGDLMRQLDATSTTSEAVISPPNPLCRVRGWLKLFVVVKLYITPVWFVLTCILACIGFGTLAEDHPAVVLVGIVQLAVGGFLVWKWIQIAQHLRSVQPGAVRETKTWLKLSLGWVFFSILLGHLSGMDVETLLLADIKAGVGSLIGFAIWYSYFNVSKRVKATYPDWNE